MLRYRLIAPKCILWLHVTFKVVPAMAYGNTQHMPESNSVTLVSSCLCATVHN